MKTLAKFRWHLYRKAGNCSAEQGRLELRDGEDGSAPLLARLCGSHVPPPVTSRGSSLHLHVANTNPRHGDPHD